MDDLIKKCIKKGSLFNLLDPEYHLGKDGIKVYDVINSILVKIKYSIDHIKNIPNLLEYLGLVDNCYTDISFNNKQFDTNKLIINILVIFNSLNNIFILFTFI